jgi:hypothetical protein
MQLFKQLMAIFDCNYSLFLIGLCSFTSTTNQQKSFKFQLAKVLQQRRRLTMRTTSYRLGFLLVV